MDFPIASSIWPPASGRVSRPRRVHHPTDQHSVRRGSPQKLILSFELIDTLIEVRQVGHELYCDVAYVDPGV